MPGPQPHVPLGRTGSSLFAAFDPGLGAGPGPLLASPTDGVDGKGAYAQAFGSLKAGTTDPPPAPPDPKSIVVQGSSRPMVNLLLFALAEREDAGFHWLDVRTPGKSMPGPDPVTLGWVGPGHLWSLDPSEALAPDPVRLNAAIFELIRDDEPPAVISRLTEFLGLPQTIQEILGTMQPPRGPGVLAVANVDRIADSFPGEVILPILNALQFYRCSLFVGSSRRTPRVVPGFTHIVCIDGESLVDWREARVTLKRGAPFAGLRLDTPVAVAELPFVARVFSSAGGGLPPT
jgi:hypothetical protein